MKKKTAQYQVKLIDQN